MENIKEELDENWYINSEMKLIENWVLQRDNEVIIKLLGKFRISYACGCEKKAIL